MIRWCAAHHEKRSVRMMREAGAPRGQFQLASPPIIYPDYDGIDMPDRDVMLAATPFDGGDARTDRRGFGGVPVDRRHDPRDGYPGRDPTIEVLGSLFYRSYPTHLPTRPRSSRSHGNCRSWRRRVRTTDLVPAKGGDP